jgi:murein DD-endopeptidase MepM/ murein hydrolase activator NlpD
MTDMDPKGGGKSPLSLVIWGLLVTVFVAAAYLGGSALARQLMSPPTSPLPGPTAAPEQVTASAAAGNRIKSGVPIESTLGAGSEDEWQFEGRGGQAATLEMWLHPGSGSSVDAELSMQLIAPDGSTVASESGSAFLVPYVFAPSLPETGLYRVQVAPTSGVPGRYSLALTLSDGSVPVAAGGPTTPQPTGRAAVESVATVSQGTFIWPSTRREISGWTFHDPGNPGHIGLDIAARMWDPIVSIADGTVAFAEWGGGYGNLVIVEHTGGWSSYYAHLDKFAVKAGQEVRQGELLGGAGTTGYSTGPHLHFEIRYQGRPVDPHVHLP